MAQCSSRLRRLILLARPDQTTNNYYRNFKWQRGKSVTPIVGSAAPVCGSFTTPMLYQSVTPTSSTSSSWFFTVRSTLGELRQHSPRAFEVRTAELALRRLTGLR